jgi:altronate dehydratase small subunit
MKSMPAPSLSSDAGTDRRLLLLHADDNVLVTRAAIPAGEPVLVGGVEVTMARALPLGHKVARRRIAAGEKVRKYGAPIGTATRAIAPGEHVHVHNLSSDYTASITLQGAAS